MRPEILERPPPPADLRMPYGPDETQIGELWLPADDGPHPVVVLLHGGYWRARYGLEYFGHAAAALRDERLAAWSVEYRRLGNPGGGYPNTFLDVGRAPDALRGLAERFPLDLRRVVALGHSAGGQLALWAAGRHRLPDNDSLTSPDPLRLPCVGRRSVSQRLALRSVAAGGAPDPHSRHRRRQRAVGAERTVPPGRAGGRRPLRPDGAGRGRSLRGGR